MPQTEAVPTEAPVRSRRDVLSPSRGTGIGGVALAAAALGGGMLASSAAHAAPAITDTDIFNFALNFEYLGAQYYLGGLGTSITGVGGRISGRGTQGTVMYPGGAPTAVPFDSSLLADFFTQLAVDEYAHTTFIQEALGANAIAMPTIDFTTAYTDIAMAAGLITSGTFNPFANETNFLLGAYLLEDVCVTALAGAAGLVQNKTLLAYAAGFLGVEAQQAGAIRGFAAQFGLNAATDKISALRAQLSMVGDNGTGDQNNLYNISNGDGQAQAFRRTPQQVLAIAFSGAGKTSGGIFPQGVNGTNAALLSS